VLDVAKNGECKKVWKVTLRKSLGSGRLFLGHDSDDSAVWETVCPYTALAEKNPKTNNPNPPLIPSSLKGINFPILK